MFAIFCENYNPLAIKYHDGCFAEEEVRSKYVKYHLLESLGPAVAFLMMIHLAQTIFYIRQKSFDFQNVICKFKCCSKGKGLKLTESNVGIIMMSVIGPLCVCTFVVAVASYSC